MFGYQWSRNEKYNMSRFLACILVVAALLQCGSAQVLRDPVITWLHDVPPAHLLRRVEGKVVDLRPWWAWSERVNAAGRELQIGNRSAALAQAYSTACPLVGWGAIVGEVQFVRPDGDVAVSLSNGENVYLRNWPGRAGAVSGSRVSVLAQRIGTANATTVTGAARTLRLFDYGVPLPTEEIAAMMKAEAEAATKAKAVKDQAEAETAARVEKARAERAAKEAAEKQPVK